MIVISIHAASGGRVNIPTREAGAEARPVRAGDFAIVRSLDGGVEYVVHLSAAAGPQCWRGTVVAIDREGQPALGGHGPELDDVVELDQSEMGVVIRGQRTPQRKRFWHRCQAAVRALSEGRRGRRHLGGEPLAGVDSLDPVDPGEA